MPVHSLVRTHWNGTSGGPGITQLAVGMVTGANFSSTDAQNAVDRVRIFWDAIKAFLPDELTLQVDPNVDEYDTASGSLIASRTAATTPPVVTGTSATTYTGGAGAKLTLNTNAVYFGRRVRGSIYLVPVYGSAYTSSGTITTSFQTSLNTAGAAMISGFATVGQNLLVYSRPNPLATPARLGFTHIVANITCNEKSAILRGRRD